MLFFLHLLRALFYTALIVGTPTLIITGGHVPAWLFQHPAYQFFVLLVLAYTVGPVVSEFIGNHAGAALFFPNSPNLNHPTISHIITLQNKRLYKEAQEELRMMTELFPDEFRAYKMLLSISALHIPDRGLFDMMYRKGMQNLTAEEEKDLLKRFRDELIDLKKNKNEPWPESSAQDEHHTRHFYVNRKHHREKSKLLVESHSATLPPRESKEQKNLPKPAGREEKSAVKKAVVPHHFHPVGDHHVSRLPEAKDIELEKSGELISGDVSHETDEAIEHFGAEQKTGQRYKFVRPRR